MDVLPDGRGLMEERRIGVSRPPKEALPVITRDVGDTLIVLGPGTTAHLGTYLERLGRRRAYLVTSPSVSAGQAGSRVKAALAERLVGVYPRARPHVPIESVNEAFEDAHRRSADIVIGLGGGSPIGTAKAVAAKLMEGGNGPGTGCIVAAVPTTYAGSEVTPVYGTTDLVRGRKSVVRNPLIRPRLALYDPELAVETPPTLTASTGVNALAHCVEALYSKNATPEDRGMAEHAAGLLIKHLPLCTAAPGDLYHRYKLFEGSMEAGLVLASAGMGVHHGLCHVLGGRFNVPHGELNAVVLPHAMRFNLPIAESAYGSLAAALNVREGPDVPEQVVRATAEFIRHLGLPQRLRDMGIPEDSLPSLAEEALQSSAVRNNPRPIAGVSDLLGILTSAW